MNQPESSIPQALADYYVSGPMSGYPEFNVPAFAAAASMLREAGYSVVSPHEVAKQPTWEAYMRADMVLLVAAKAVVVLPGWEASRGARLEVHVAHALGMPVVPLALALSAKAAA